MTTRTVTCEELPIYLGCWIDFEWTDGWDDYRDSGYLYGFSDWVNEYGGDPRQVVHLSKDPDDASAPEHMGGYAARADHKFTVDLLNRRQQASVDIRPEKAE